MFHTLETDNSVVLRRCPSFTQVQESECGPASLGMMLAYFGCYLLLPKLSEECKVTRDGTHVVKLLSVAKKYGLDLAPKPYKFNRLKEEPNMPCMAYWQYSHWIVIEGYSDKGFYINDPGDGRSFKSNDEFSQGYSNIILKVVGSSNIQKQGSPWILDQLLVSALAPLKKYLLASIVFSTLFSIPSIVVAFCTGLFVENVVQDGWQNWLNPILSLVLLMALAQIIIRFFQYYLQRRIRLKAQKSSAEAFSTILFRQKSEFFDRRNPGEVSSRITQLDGLISLVTSAFIAGSSSTASTLLYVFIIFCINPFMGLFTLSVLLAYSFIIYKVGGSLLDKSKRLSVSSGYAYGATLLAIDNAHSVKSMSLQTGVLDTWLNSFFKQSSSSQEITVRSQGIDSIADLTDSILKLGLIGLGSYLVIQNLMTLSSLVAISMLFQAMSPEIKDIVQYLKDLAASYGDIARVSDALLTDSDRSIPDLFPGFSSRKDIIHETRCYESELKSYSKEILIPIGTTFSYDSESKFAIYAPEDITINTRKHYKLENPPGTGRTTFFKLLTGELTWSDVPPSSIPTSQGCLKRIVNVAYFTERATLFPGTILDSITTYKSFSNDETYASICQQLDIQKYIENIPERLEFVVNANQTNISFRTAMMMDIARAISNNASMLLFDYSLDSLDSTFRSRLFNLCDANGIGTITATRLSETLFRSSNLINLSVVDPSQAAQKGENK